MACPWKFPGSFNTSASRATYNEIDAVIYLRDPVLETYDMPNPLLKACDTNIIPVATNSKPLRFLILVSIEAILTGAN